MEPAPEPSPFVAAALADPGLLVDRFLDEWCEALPPHVAAAIGRWHPSEELGDAMREYFERAGEGELSREQKAADRELTHMADLANLLRSSAARHAGVEPAPAVPTAARAARTASDAPQSVGAA